MEEKEEWKECRIGGCHNKILPWEFVCDSCYEEYVKQELEDLEREFLESQEREEDRRRERSGGENGSK